MRGGEKGNRKILSHREVNEGVEKEKGQEWGKRKGVDR